MTNEEIVTTLQAHPELISQVLEILTRNKQKPNPAGYEEGVFSK